MVRRLLNPWEPTSCALQGGPTGRDHVVLTGSAGPKELWEMVWEHGAHVVVSLGLPDTKEKVRGVEGRDVWLQEWGRERRRSSKGQSMSGDFGSCLRSLFLVLATRHLANGDAACCHRHGDSAQNG